MPANHTNSIICALLLAISIASTAACGGADERKARYLAKAKDYMAQKEYGKAEVALKNYLQIDPKQPEIYFLYGQISEQKQAWQNAFGNYSKAIELDPDYIEALARLAPFYLASGDAKKARDVAENIFRIQPNHADGNSILASALLLDGDVDGAVRIIEGAVRDYPNDMRLADQLASLYVKQGKPDRATDVLVRGIGGDPSNITLRSSLAQIYEGRRDFNNAERILKEIIGIEPDNMERRVTLSMFYSRQNKIDAAEAVMRDIARMRPEEPDSIAHLADFLIDVGKTAEAEKELEAAIGKAPHMAALRLKLAGLYKDGGNADKAILTYRKIISEGKSRRDRIVAKTSLAELFIQQGLRDEAEELAREVLAENPRDNGALLIIGKLALARGDAVGAMDALRTILRDQPDSIEVLTLLAQAHLLRGEPEMAKDSLSTAVERNPASTRARLAYARMLAKSGDTSAALATLDQGIAGAPENIDLLVEKADVLEAANNTLEAQQILESVRDMQPDSPFGHYGLGQFYMRNDLHDDALREFEAALGKTRDIYQPLSLMTGIYLSQNKPELAIEKISGYKNHPETAVVAHELLAEVYISIKKYSEAENELLQAIETSPKWNVPYRNLANIYLLQNNLASAETVYRKALKVMPDDPQLLLSLAESYELVGNYKEAIKICETILDKNPHAEPIINKLAALLADDTSHSGALARAKTLALRLENSRRPEYLDTLAWIYFREGEIDRALSYYESILKQIPDSPQSNYHIGMVYLRKGDNESAARHLAKALSGNLAFRGMKEARKALLSIHQPQQNVHIGTPPEHQAP